MHSRNSSCKLTASSTLYNKDICSYVTLFTVTNPQDSHDDFPSSVYWKTPRDTLYASALTSGWGRRRGYCGRVCAGRGRDIRGGRDVGRRTKHRTRHNQSITQHSVYDLFHPQACPPIYPSAVSSSPILLPHPSLPLSYPPFSSPYFHP